MAYHTLSDLEFNGKTVLVRLDLNVPIKKGGVTDTTRIDESIPTIQHILKHGGKPVLMSHLGRPDGKRNPEESLAPVAKIIQEKTGTKVTLAPDCIGEKTEALAKNLPKNEILLLENLRFHAGEEENTPEFVSQLANLGDVYINDAFGTAHRAHASTYGLPLLFKKQNKPTAAGILMDKELEIWKPIVEGKGKAVAIVGGAKLKEKMDAVKKFSKTFDRIILGGVVANVFMKAKGLDIGDSRYLEKEKDYTEMAKEILANDPDKKVRLPQRVVLATTDFTSKGASDAKPIEKGLMSADVLPTEQDVQAIKEAERVVWFGPMGAYEFGFKEGSQAIVKAIAESKAYVVIGGGDLAAAAVGVQAKISTGGGAAINYITKGKLEALEALSIQNE